MASARCLLRQPAFVPQSRDYGGREASAARESLNRYIVTKCPPAKPCLRTFAYPQGDGYRRLKSLSGDSARTVLTTAKK